MYVSLKFSMHYLYKMDSLFNCSEAKQFILFICITVLSVFSYIDYLLSFEKLNKIWFLKSTIFLLCYSSFIIVMLHLIESK